MKQHFLNLFWPLLFAAKKAPLRMFSEVVVSLLCDAYPALNVLLIGYLGQQYAAGQDITFPLMALALLFGAKKVIDQISFYIGRMQAMALIVAAKYDFNQKMVAFGPYHYNDTEKLEKLRVAVGSFSDGQINNQYHALLSIISGVATAILLFGALASFNLLVALLSLGVPVILVTQQVMTGKIYLRTYPKEAEIKRRSSYLYDQMDRDRTGFELATMQAGNVFSKLIAQAMVQYGKVRMQFIIAICRLQSIDAVLISLIYASCVVLLVQQNDLATLMAGIFGLTASLSAFLGIGFQLGLLSQAVPANKALREFLEQQIATPKQHSLVGVTKLQVQNITVSYGNKVAVKGVDLTLEKGKLVALVGHNGCGKTSLIKAIMGTQANATGHLVFNDTKLDLSSTTDTLSYATINQEFQKYDITIREFVTLGLTNQVSEELIWQALEKVAIADYVRNLELGLDSLAGMQWGGVDLSGGQWQRLCIARGLLSDKALLFLDEPTSAIDAQTEEAIFKQLKQVSDQRLVLLTTHRVASLKDADYIYVMEQGEIVEQGTFDQLNQAGTKFRDLFAAQFVNDETTSSSESSNSGLVEQPATC